METRQKGSIFGRCRFCNVEGNHRSLMKEYTYINGKSEVYYNMFMECFNLFLSTAPELNKLICWVCISSLRDAVSFRAKVAAAEQALLGSLLNKDTIFINVPTEHSGQDLEVKTELVNDVKLEHSLTDDEQVMHNIGVDVDENGMDYRSDSPLQYDDASDNILLTEDSKYLVEGEAEFVAKYHTRDFRLPTRSTLYTNSCARFVNHLDSLKEVHSAGYGEILLEGADYVLRPEAGISNIYCKKGQTIVPKMLQKLLEESGDDVMPRVRNNFYVTEKMAYITNALTLLQYSNATPFKSKTRLGFPCYYCRNIFENLEKLKEHQSAMHRRTDLRKIMCGYGAECLVVYADITDLKCTICNESIPKLQDLKSHLIKRHNKKMFTELNDRVIPFKLSPSNVYECQMCGFNFETFGSIERHMNVHFRNYVCKECGTGFVTKYRLKVHTKSMHIEGNFPCEVCKKVFTTQQKQKNHVDTVHKLVKRFKCPKCQERFSEYFRRQKHLVEVHGVAPLQYKCNVCDKSFDRRYTLSRHMKRDHLEERDFQCQMCTYKCFTKNELNVHMIKHNGERVHECSVCKKSYARKKTLREHMRIHNNDRRFACAMCGQAFIQKCSLKGHIKTHHLDYSLQ